MQKHKSYLTQLLGTTTKARIIEYLIINPEQITRNALCKNISAGIGPTYEQIDHLIALGILKEIDEKVEVDVTFPFYDDIANLVVSTSNFIDDHRILLERINKLFNNDYYITGYIAACQNGPPIDYEQKSALVAVLNLNQNTHWNNYLVALSKVTSIKLKWFDNKVIPDDVKLEKTFEANAWLASVERGIVDSFVYQDCDLYPIVLLLLQNISEQNLNGEKLKSIAKSDGSYKFFLSVILEINNIMDDKLIKLSPIETKIAKKNLKLKISKLVEKAQNTLMGG